MRLPSEPVKQTCPDINRLQKTIEEIRNNFASFKDTDNVDDFLSYMVDASWELRGVYDTLEELRSANSALRDWGHELTSLVEQMENEKDSEIGELEIEISAKEDKIEELEEIIDELKEQIENDNILSNNRTKNPLVVKAT